MADFLEAAYRRTYLPLLSVDRRELVGDRMRDWNAVLADGPNVRATLAERRNAIVGFARSEPARGGESGNITPVRERELHLLYLGPACFGTGLASRLLESVLAPHEPAEVWVVHNNTRAVRFYAGHGFTPDGREEDLGTVADYATGMISVRLVR